MAVGRIKHAIKLYEDFTCIMIVRYKCMNVNNLSLIDNNINYV